MKQLAIIIIFSILVTTGCSSEQPRENSDSTNNSSEQPREYNDSTSNIDVKVGKEFVLSLSSNQTTGYQWQLAEPLDESILELKDSKYKAPETERVGAGGKEAWTFKAVGKGETNISLKYVRSWEKDAPPEKSKTFVVTVH